jgi:hypothetical protein
MTGREAKSQAFPIFSKMDMSTTAKDGFQKALLFLGVALVHIFALLALAHVIVFSAPDENIAEFKGIKIMLPSQPAINPPASVLLMPALEFAGSNRTTGQSADLSPGIPISQMSFIHSFNDAITKTINFEVQNGRNGTMQFMTKANINQETHGAANGGKNDGATGKGDGIGVGDDKNAREAGDLFPTSEDEKVVIVIERQPGPRYLWALRHHYPKATIVLSWSGRGDYSPDPKIWTPAPNQACNTDGTVTPDPQHPWIDDQELDAKGPDIFTCDLYAGIYWAMHHGSKTVIVISNFDVITNFQHGYNRFATQALITAMHSAHLQLFVVAGGHVSPLRDLSDYAIECGGTSVIDGPYYGSPNWESYAHLLREK